LALDLYAARGIIGHQQGRYEMSKQETYEALCEVRTEISRINLAAGHAVFNPTATQLLEQVMRRFDA